MIEFYILSQQKSHRSMIFVCELVAELYQQAKQTYLHVDNAEEANAWDALLWTYDPERFIPHKIYSTDGQETPIYIGYTKQPTISIDIGVNLSQETPPFYPSCNRCIEIVFADAACQYHARERFKQYRESGQEIKTHKFDKLTTRALLT